MIVWLLADAVQLGMLLLILFALVLQSWSACSNQLSEHAMPISAQVPMHQGGEATSRSLCHKFHPFRLPAPAYMDSETTGGSACHWSGTDLLQTDVVQMFWATVNLQQMMAISICYED